MFVYCPFAAAAAAAAAGVKQRQQLLTWQQQQLAKQPLLGSCLTPYTVQLAANTSRGCNPC
jgi:hypothetical protein